MTEGRFGAGMESKRSGDRYTNGFLVFDYMDLANFKYAGMYVGQGQWVIGERVNWTYTNRETVTETAGIDTETKYNLEVVVSGNSVTLKVDGQTKVSHTFASGVDGGEVGLLVRNAIGPAQAAPPHFDDVWAEDVVSEKKYYMFGAQRVAMRRESVLYSLVGDHVRSAERPGPRAWYWMATGTW
jgi:hypothetical protein